MTLWEDDAVPGGARVPRRFTDALKASDHTVAERSDPRRDRDRDRRDTPRGQVTVCPARRSASRAAVSCVSRTRT